MLHGDDGYLSTFESVELRGEGEVSLMYVPQFQGYSLDLPITLEVLLSDEPEWIALVHGGIFEELIQKGVEDE